MHGAFSHCAFRRVALYWDFSSTTSRLRPRIRGDRSEASCLCTVLRRALYHYSTRSPAWFEVVLNLNLNWFWTVLEPSVLEFLFKCLSVLVRSCGLVCRVVFGVLVLSLLCSAVSVVWSSMQRSPKLQHWKVLQRPCNLIATMLSSTCTRDTLQCLDKGSAKLSYQLLGLITKGLEDNTTEELLEPWSSEAKIPSWKAFEKDLKRYLSLFWIVFEWS